MSFKLFGKSFKPSDDSTNEKIEVAQEVTEEEEDFVIVGRSSFLNSGYITTVNERNSGSEFLENKMDTNYYGPPPPYAQVAMPMPFPTQIPMMPMMGPPPSTLDGNDMIKSVLVLRSSLRPTVEMYNPKTIDQIVNPNLVDWTQFEYDFEFERGVIRETNQMYYQYQS